MNVAEALAAATAKAPARKSDAEYSSAKAKRFRASAAWRRVRYRVLADNAKRNDGVARCDLCHRSARESGGPLHVDHIRPISRGGWAQRFDPASLQVLCRDCNEGKGNRDATDFRPESSVIDAK